MVWFDYQKAFEIILEDPQRFADWCKTHPDEKNDYFDEDFKAVRKLQLDAIMNAMGKNDRSRWCDAIGGCCCMGCATIGGNLIREGYTRKDWEEWMQENNFPILKW